MQVPGPLLCGNSNNSCNPGPSTLPTGLREANGSGGQQCPAPYTSCLSSTWERRGRAQRGPRSCLGNLAPLSLSLADPCVLREAVLRQRAETEDDGQRQAPAAPGAAPRVQVPGPRPAAAPAAARSAGPHAHLPGGWLPPMMAHLRTLDLRPLPSALRGRGPPSSAPQVGPG